MTSVALVVVKDPRAMYEAKKRCVKNLIYLAMTAEDKDKEIQTFFPECAGEDTIERLKAKMKILDEMFPSDSQALLMMPAGATEFDVLATDYYSYLQVCILRGYKTELIEAAKE